MQTSSQQLHPLTQYQIMRQFDALLADLTSIAEVRMWLDDFMTSTERQVFAKRLAVAQMLLNKKSYQEIKDTLKVSSATISSVAETIHKPGHKLASRRIELDGWARRWYDYLTHPQQLFGAQIK